MPRCPVCPVGLQIRPLTALPSGTETAGVMLPAVMALTHQIAYAAWYVNYIWLCKVSMYIKPTPQCSKTAKSGKLSTRQRIRPSLLCMVQEKNGWGETRSRRETHTRKQQQRGGQQQHLQRLSLLRAQVQGRSWLGSCCSSSCSY